MSAVYSTTWSSSRLKGRMRNVATSKSSLCVSIRYPFYAAEVLSSEIKDINDLFFVESPPKQTTVEPEKKEGESQQQAGTADVQSPEKVSEQKKEEVKTEETAPAVESKPAVEEKKEEEVAKTEEEKVEVPIEEAKKEEQKTEEKQHDSPVHVDDILFDSPKEEDKQNVPKNPNARYWLLDKLLSLLNTKGQVNTVLAGYFAKVVQMLLERRRQDFLDYIFRYSEFVENFIRHSYNKSVAEVLSRIISNDDRFSVPLGNDEFVTEKLKILSKLIDKMGPDNSSDDITNSGYIIYALVDTRQHLKFFTSEPVLTTIFKFAQSANPMSLRAALTFCVIMYRLKSNPQPPADSGAAFLGFSRPERMLFHNIHPLR